MNHDASIRPDVRAEVVANLLRDYKFKESGDWLRQGKCPSCGKHELFVHAQNPWVVRCGKLNNCGWEETTRKLYPDAFGKFNERFPATTQDPNATADAYMRSVRGFDPSKIKGWYRQGRYSHPRGDHATASVVFDIDRERGIFMERLVETVRVQTSDGVESRKANFEGKHQGLWWLPPGKEIKEGDLWLVEGCMDAIALWLHGVQSAAILSCVNFPEAMLEKLDGKKVRLVWALDNDRAGNSFTRKHIAKANELGFDSVAAVIPQKGKAKTDWNEAHLARQLEPKDIETYRYHGDLLLAPSAKEKALLIWEQTGSTWFPLDFKSETYWFALDAARHMKQVEMLQKEPAKYEKGLEWEAARRVADVENIATCTFKFLYFMRHEASDESWYYASISLPHLQKPKKSTFTAAQLAASSEFKKRLLAIAPGALWGGNGAQLDWISKRYLRAIKEVQTVEFIGYSKEHGCWVFPDKAVAKGMAYDLNDEDFFEIDKISIKSLNVSLHLTIGEARTYDAAWVDDLYKAFGPKGIIALAYWLGALFAEQIRDVHKSFPFLEIIGEPGAGKSTLIEFLWKLVGRADYEGFDPNKSTTAARARIMSQVSNLPVCMIESDRGGEDTAKVRQFDWDELKPAYNGRPSRATGVKNGGNDTKEPPFRGSIVISQNAQVNASDAIMQRIVHLHFTCAKHSNEGKDAADRLSTMAVEKISHFLLMATTAEAQLMKLFFARTAQYETKVMAEPEVKHFRLAKNHGQMMALVDCLDGLVKLPADVRAETMKALMEAAKERQRAIANDHPIVEKFWEIFDFLGEDLMDHAREDSVIAISLPHFEREAARNNLKLPDMLDLKRHLKSSQSHTFIEIKTVNSKSTAFVKDGEGQGELYAGKAVKCWIFAKSKGGKHG
ncbi:MAG: toprim domain-containing protein [Alphaproteobacteria bacterium]|nr:toprim domain-containing protein [Alphaproteobacteria bacterium]